MLLSVDEMVKLLRNSVNVQDPDNSDEIDSSYLSLTDEDIKLFIKLGMSRVNSDVEDIDEISSDMSYPVVLLAKVELYGKLAIMRAEKVDLGADGAYIKNSQRFDHYMELAKGVKEEYQSWLNNEGKGSIQTYDILLSDRHYTHRNYEKQVTPKVSLIIDEVTSSTIDFHWTMKNSSHFGRFKVYVNTEPVFDNYVDGSSYKDKLSTNAILVKSTGDIRDTYHRLTNLKQGTKYYILVLSIERNQVFGYAIKEVTTLEEETDVSVTSLN